MRIAVTGAAGLFGTGFVRIASETDQVLGLTRTDADVTNRGQLLERLRPFRPEVIVHAAAIPSPDVCELQPDLAYRVNVGGTESVVAVAQELGAAVALISTDAVFDGTKGSPYVEGDERNPISVYGRTKVEAENRVRELEKHYVFRVSVLFGRDKLDFVSKGLVEIDAGREYRVPSDQIGSATYVDDASSTMLEVLRKTAYGTFHICNAGVCSRYDIAVLACDLAGLDVGKVVGVPLVKMNRPGPRVPYSVMETGELRRRGFGELRDWKAAMAEYLTAIQGNKFFRS